VSLYEHIIISLVKIHNEKYFRYISTAGQFEKEHLLFKLTYPQISFIPQINELTVTFDAELHLLRHQKLKLDTKMKLSDLHHLTLFQEMLLLKNFEKQENILQERVNSLDKEEQDMQVRAGWILTDCSP
jgi:hypothetical protein